MKNIDKLLRELQEIFPTRKVKIESSEISIDASTIWNIDKEKILNLEKKYKAISYIDSRENGVRWHIHSIYEPPEPKYAEYLGWDDTWKESLNTVEQIKNFDKGSTTIKYRYFSSAGLTYRIKNTE